MKIEKAKRKLIKGIKELALEVKPKGEFFELKGGGKSSYYLDMRIIHLHPKYMDYVVRLLRHELEKLKVNFNKFGGPSIGADPIIGALCSRKVLMNLESIPTGYLIRPEPKDHGKSGRIVGDVRAGDACVLIEDVATTGKSSVDAIKVLQEAEASVVHVFSIVDRLGGAGEKFAELNIPYTALLNIRDLGIHD